MRAKHARIAADNEGALRSSLADHLPRVKTRFNLPDDCAKDAVDLKILWRVNRRDACGPQSPHVGGRNDAPTMSGGTCSRPAARKSVSTSSVSAICEPDRIDRPTQWTPDLAASTISAGVSRMPS
jgi:hypothetical protein